MLGIVGVKKVVIYFKKSVNFEQDNIILLNWIKTLLIVVQLMGSKNLPFL